MVPEEFDAQLHDVLESVRKMLEEKNRKYGNSALDPVRVFSRASTAEQLRVRIDDKLSRLRNRQDDDDEDTVMDLIGYLVLYRMHQIGERTK